MAADIPLPDAAFGTSHQVFSSDSEVYTAVKAALLLGNSNQDGKEAQGGFSAVDTAARYRSEKAVGRALRDASPTPETPAAGNETDAVSDPFFVTTKLWPGDCASAETVSDACRESIRSLGRSDRLDLYLVHWPGLGLYGERTDREGREETWRALERLLETGVKPSPRADPVRLDRIGVSNFLSRHLEEMEDYATVWPAVNQIEFNPLQQAPGLLEICAEKGTKVQAYAPLGKGHCLRDRDVNTVAQRTRLTPAQVLVAWSWQRGVAPVVASTRTEHIEELSEVLGRLRGAKVGDAVVLSPDDMGLLGPSKHANLRVTWDPSRVP
jgi:methylglyoxal/glyoxal reductase